MLGVALGMLLCSRREKRFSLPKDTTVNLILIALPLALVCARAYYVIFSWDYYSAHPDRILSVRDGGLAIYGGLLGGMLGVFLYARHAKIPFMQLADLAAPALALGQCIGRWGNFVNQEAYGNPVTDPAWQFFPAAVYIEREGGYFQATFFYESAWCFLIVLFLLLAEKRGWFRERGHGFWPTRCCTRWSAPWWKVCAATAWGWGRHPRIPTFEPADRAGDRGRFCNPMAS